MFDRARIGNWQDGEGIDRSRRMQGQASHRPYCNIVMWTEQALKDIGLTPEQLLKVEVAAQ